MVEVASLVSARLAGSWRFDEWHPARGMETARPMTI
jgi:hypothetical protein